MFCASFYVRKKRPPNTTVYFSCSTLHRCHGTYWLYWTKYRTLKCSCFPAPRLDLLQNICMFHTSVFQHFIIIQHDMFSMFGSIRSFTRTRNKVLCFWTVLGCRICFRLESAKRVHCNFRLVVKAQLASACDLCPFSVMSGTNIWSLTHALLLFFTT